jgi:hypothetical protein
LPTLVSIAAGEINIRFRIFIWLPEGLETWSKALPLGVPLGVVASR